MLVGAILRIEQPGRRLTFMLDLRGMYLESHIIRRLGLLFARFATPHCSSGQVHNCCKTYERPISPAVFSASFERKVEHRKRNQDSIRLC